LLGGSKENGTEVNADETKYMVMSRDRNADQSHNINIANSYCERVEEFRYLGRAFNITNYNKKELRAD
jgi:hypothetical protein